MSRRVFVVFESLVELALAFIAASVVVAAVLS